MSADNGEERMNFIPPPPLWRPLQNVLGEESFVLYLWLISSSQGNMCVNNEPPLDDNSQRGHFCHIWSLGIDTKAGDAGGE